MARYGELCDTKCRRSDVEQEICLRIFRLERCLKSTRRCDVMRLLGPCRPCTVVMLGASRIPSLRRTEPPVAGDSKRNEPCRCQVTARSVVVWCGKRICIPAYHSVIGVSSVAIFPFRRHVLSVEHVQVVLVPFHPALPLHPTPPPGYHGRSLASLTECLGYLDMHRDGRVSSWIERPAWRESRDLPVSVDLEKGVMALVFAVSTARAPLGSA